MKKYTYYVEKYNYNDIIKEKKNGDLYERQC